MHYVPRLTTLLFSLFSLIPFMAQAEHLPEVEAADTTILVDGVQVTAIKQGMVLRSEPIASTILGERAISRNHISALKDLTDQVPNLHIPDYGSRMTSSIYVRGLGARIDHPVLGMTVDNVPLMQKNGFDAELSDIERVEVLRGPQSTLYGRNTMGGVVNIYTLSPFNYEGARVEMGYSTGNTFRLRASFYEQFSDKWATSVSAYRTTSDGFFKNELTGEDTDWEKMVGGRWKLLFRNNKGLRIENTLSISETEQGGYPYAFLGGRSEGVEGITPGLIAYNDTCRYDRLTLSDGLTIQYENDRHSLTSITSYQLTDDDMRLDNDFTPLDYFTLRQAIKEHVVTEDVIFRSKGARTYNYLFGLYGFYRDQHMEAPVLFKEAGINAMMFAPANAATGGRVQMTANEAMPLGSDFENPNYGAAIYHESSFRFGKWEAKAGIRVENEHTKLDYHSYGKLNYHLKLSMPGMPRPMESDQTVDLDERGSYSHSYTEVLPKFSLIYRFDENRNLYASVSRGFKAGGFNTQLFSDILKEKLQTKAQGGEYEEQDIVSYKPEYSWNYEVGGHFSCAEGVIRGDFALFMIDCRDQQLTVLADADATGRMMTNAGRTRSLGGELAMQFKPWSNLDIDLAYGYTKATFRRYKDGETDYRGNSVPFAPRNTLSAGLTWTIPTGVKWLGDVVLHGAMKGVGKIYWNESNSEYQPYYTTFNASVRLEHKNYTLDFWGENLTDKAYDIFYFESIGNRFVQRSRPRLLGVTLSINIQ